MEPIREIMMSPIQRSATSFCPGNSEFHCNCLVPYLHHQSFIGVIAHGRRTYGFAFLENVRSGTNAVIQAMHEVFMDIWSLDGKLPHHLYLQVTNCCLQSWQLDNTSKQNKNRFLVGYCAFLVQCGLFKSVRVSFLPVGHTHEDIDRVFSRVHHRLRQVDMLSRLTFGEVFTSAFKHYGE